MSIHVQMGTVARLRQRPFEHLLAASLLISGVSKFFGADGPLVTHLDGPVTTLWAWISVLAAAAVTIGLHWRGDSLIRSTIEQIGWAVGVISALGGPAILWLADYPLDTQLADDVLIAGAAGLRIWYLSREHRAIKRLRLMEIEAAKIGRD